MMFVSVVDVFYCSFITMRSIYQLYSIHNIMVSVAHTTRRHCDARVGQGPMVLYRCYTRQTTWQIQNCLARTVVKAPKSSHITPILRSLHWLKINERIEYKLLSLTYKVLTTSQPDYLHSQSYLCSVYR